MAVVVGLVSQKGGVGKSTLARALGAVVAHAGLKVRIADLDPQQHTVVEWERMRGENRLAPALDVRGFATVAQALAGMADDELAHPRCAGAREPPDLGHRESGGPRRPTHERQHRRSAARDRALSRIGAGRHSQASAWFSRSRARSARPRRMRRAPTSRRPATRCSPARSPSAPRTAKPTIAARP